MIRFIKRLDLENYDICPEMKQFLSRCFEEKPVKRPSFFECIEKAREIAELIKNKKTKFLCPENDDSATVEGGRGTEPPPLPPPLPPKQQQQQHLVFE